MAGVKGRSGGARPGAGRPPKEPTILQLASQYEDPRAFLRAVMNDAATDVKIRVDAAKALMPYEHQKPGETGKKEAMAEAAKKVASKFSVAQPPKLVAAGGKRLP